MKQSVQICPRSKIGFLVNPIARMVGAVARRAPTASQEAAARELVAMPHKA